MPSIYGFHPVREALRHRPHEVAGVLVSSRRRDARRTEIATLCRRHGVALRAVSPAELTRQAGPRHGGFLAELRGLEARGPASTDDTLLVLVEDVQDPRNLGALLRVCEGVGVGRVLIRDRGTTALTPLVVKASTGATEWLAIERITNPAATLRELKKDGFWVYGAVPGGQPPWELDLQGRVVVCVGGEERGLRARTRQSCDALVGLPMRGRVGSLNLATAAAALLYEALRQRASPPSVASPPEGLPPNGDAG